MQDAQVSQFKMVTEWTGLPGVGGKKAKVLE
jgi:hypothetical protein